MRETSSGVGSGTGRVKRNVAPAPLADGSSQMRPPWCSIDLAAHRQADPVPVYASFVCRRWKITKIRSLYCGSMPIPLSATVKRQKPSSRSTETCTRGGRRRGT